MSDNIVDRLRESWLAASRASFDNVDCGVAANLLDEAAAEIERLQSALDAAVRDAERWRWARANPQWLGFDHDMMAHEIDNAIDSAISSERGGK